VALEQQMSSCVVSSVRIGTDDIITVVQQNSLRRYGHILKRMRMVGLKNAWILKWKM